jgi:hypothetical protein
MTVADGQLLSAGKGAELIREQTGRSCTRQNLEKLCKQGRLPASTASTAPVRVRAASLVAEYLSKVDPRQSVRERPGIAQAVLDREPVSAPPPPPSGDSPDKLPDYTESKKKTEYEKGLILELERKQKEGTLLAKEEVERAWANAIGKVKSRILAVPSAAKQRIPHLDPEEVEILKDMLREALFELAAQGER